MLFTPVDSTVINPLYSSLFFALRVSQAFGNQVSITQIAICGEIITYIILYGILQAHTNMITANAS